MLSPREVVKEPISVGQIGIGGGIAPLHLSEMEKNPNFRVVAGCDTRLAEPAVAKQAQRITGGGGKVYATYQEVLADPRVEAVVISVPHFLHREISVAAFAAGKHVLCEKPMATHPDDCRAMCAARDKSGKVGAVQMQHVGRSSMTNLRQRIADGAIGQLREVFISSIWWRENSYYNRTPWAGKKMLGGNWNLDGAIFNQAIHFINQALVLAAPGPLPAVAAVRQVRSALYRLHDTPQLEMEDTAFVRGTLEVPGEPAVWLMATTCGPVDQHTIELLGEKGRALWNGTGYLMARGQPAEVFADDNREFDGTSRIFNSFAEAVRNGMPCITDFSQILRTTQFVFDCYAAADWKIKPAPWAVAPELPGVWAAALRQRALPPDLHDKPSWA